MEEQDTEDASEDNYRAYTHFGVLQFTSFKIIESSVGSEKAHNYGPSLRNVSNAAIETAMYMTVYFDCNERTLVRWYFFLYEFRTFEITKENELLARARRGG